MNLNKLIILFISAFFLYSCAEYKTIQKEEKKYYSSMGFALIYEDSLYSEKVISKKINNDDFVVIHSLLKANTPVKIINPANSKYIETKVKKKSHYPKIFNVLISKKIATHLELDTYNPYVEIFEIKKNKTFIAKEKKIFEEEKKVADKVPVDEVKMDDLSTVEKKKEEKFKKTHNYILVVSDFYFEDSAISLKNELINKTKMNNISIKKINNKKYRLLVGPFKNFNALKVSYISLNNLGFDNLNIYKE